jgi:hypothetical protein
MDKKLHIAGFAGATTLCDASILSSFFPFWGYIYRHAVMIVKYLSHLESKNDVNVCKEKRSFKLQDQGVLFPVLLL